MVEPVIPGALVWFLQRILDKGFDRLLDGAADRFDKPELSLPAAIPAMVAPRRHDLSVAGAQVTTDVDIAVRHLVFARRVPVILTFQKSGTDVGAATVPMCLGDTAHLTLRRDLYLITAMVVTHATSARAKPTLHGIGWTQEWVADNDVRKLTIATRHPTESLLNNLGLQSQDGSYPFILAPTPATTPSRTDPEMGALGATTAVRRTAVEKSRNALEYDWGMNQLRLPAAQRTTSSAQRLFTHTKCRARTSLDRQCLSPAGWTGLCPTHRREVNNG